MRERGEIGIYDHLLSEMKGLRSDRTATPPL